MRGLTVLPNFDFYFVLQTAASDISNQHETKQWKYTIRWWWTMAWEENNNFVVVCIIGPFSIVFLAEIGIPGRLFEFVSSIAHTWSKYSVGFFSVIWRMVSKKVVFEFGSYVLTSWIYSCRQICVCFWQRQMHCLIRDVPPYQLCIFLGFSKRLWPPPSPLNNWVILFDGLGDTLHCSKIVKYKT